MGQTSCLPSPRLHAIVPVTVILPSTEGLSPRALAAPPFFPVFQHWERAGKRDSVRIVSSANASRRGRFHAYFRCFKANQPISRQLSEALKGPSDGGSLSKSV